MWKRRFVLFALVVSFVVGSTAQQSAFSVNYEVIRKSVVFIYARGANGQSQPDGTGFLLFVPTKADSKRGYTVLVTARHMVDPSWTGCSQISPTLVARFNKKGAGEAPVGTVDYPLPSLPAQPTNNPRWTNWIVPADDSADVTFTVLNAAHLESIGADYGAVNIAELAKQSETKQMETGSQIMSAGLFPGASGDLRNYPVFKFGYISSRPNEKLVLKDCPNGIAREETAWIIAASLVPGNSGSPILYVPVAFGGVSFGGYGRASIIGVQSSSFVGWDVAGMTPIQYLIDALRTADIPDADFSSMDVVQSPSVPSK